MEIWKAIDGFEGYEVSDCGRVRSLDRRVRSRYNGTRLTRGVDIKPSPNSCGYMRVKLAGRIKKAVSRLVANAFIDNPFNKPEVNHIDGDRANNHASNLEWNTSSENKLHSFRDLGRTIATAKPVNQLTLDGKFIRRFDSAAKAVATVGSRKAGVGCCCRGESKTSGGFRWEFASD